MTLGSTLYAQQVDSNLDLESGWGSTFSTGVNEPTLVARAGIFTPGRTYTFSLTATDSEGAAGFAGKPIFVSFRCVVRILVQNGILIRQCVCSMSFNVDHSQTSPERRKIKPRGNEKAETYGRSLTAC